MTKEQKAAQATVLRSSFPISSGMHHRSRESEWVPVEKEPPKETKLGPVVSPPVTEKPVCIIFLSCYLYCLRSLYVCETACNMIKLCICVNKIFLSVLLLLFCMVN